MKFKEFTLTAVLFGIVRGSSISWQNCINNPVDLVFVLDGSGSVGTTRFGFFKDFLEKLILRLNVGEHGTKVAVIQLSDVKETKFEFGINNYSDVATMREAIKNIKYQYGRLQKTEVALRLAETEVFNGENTTDRPKQENVLVLITEGPSTYPVKNVILEAHHLKRSGVHLVAIGVGRKISSPEFRKELHSIASSPRDVFFTSDDEILNLVDRLDGSICPNVTASLAQTNGRARALSPTPVPVKVITSVLVKTKTIWMTSYVPALAICRTSIAPTKSSVAVITPTTSIVKKLDIPVGKTDEKSEKTSKKKTPKDFSGNLLECFQCNYDVAVAKEFSIECETQKCSPNEEYCVDAILEGAGREFVRKRCATSQFCNSTTEHCVKEFQHTGEYTDCRVTCCSGKRCNPYSHASCIAYMKFLLVFATLLVRFIVENR